MGSTCAFSPSRPHLLASLSKAGELAVIDTGRRTQAAAAAAGAAAGAAAAPRVVARQHLSGPVFGCAWLEAGALGCGVEQLAVVGADCVVRLFDASDAGGSLWVDGVDTCGDSRRARVCRERAAWGPHRPAGRCYGGGSVHCILVRYA